MSSLISKIFRWLPLGQVEEIDAQELKNIISETGKVQLLDVRTTAEWKAGHIKGSINVPITELGKRIDKLNLDKDVLLVPICLSAHRSIPAVRLFKELGFSNVRHLAGGMKAWNKHYKKQLVKA